MPKFGSLMLFLAIPVHAQMAASIAGVVTDPSGAAVSGAKVALRNRLSGFEHETISSSAGAYSIANIPPRSYDLFVTASGFATYRQTVAIASAAARAVDIRLTIATSETSTTVAALDTADLITPEDTGTRAQVNQREIERLLQSSGNRGIEGIVRTFPGFAQNANGAIHPRGAHTQMSFVIDGMPITDQLTGAFANSVDPNIAQTVEVFTGNIPAEFGAKVAAVVSVNTKSGLNAAAKFVGSAALSGASFDTLGQVTQVAGHNGRFGYSALVNTMKSHRYLDSVSLDNLHNGGNSTRGFVRLDYQVSDRDTLRLNILAGRAPFQLANLRSQHLNGMDQRQELADSSTAVNWVRTLDPRSTWEMNYSARTSTSRLFASQGDTPVTASQDRRLTTVVLAHRYTAARGRHVIRAGFDTQRFPMREQFSFGVTDPSFNDPRGPGYIETLRPFDISRGGRLFEFLERGNGGFHSGHIQDQVKLGSWQIALGLRYDAYRFLASADQWQPRVGVSYFVKRTCTVFRASYNRLLQTPQNENILISNSSKASVLVAPDVRETAGGAVVRIQAERQNLYEAGIQQALGTRWSLNASVYHKDGRNQQDVNNFFNTPIVFPMQLAAIRVNSAESRLVLTPWKGLSGSLSATHSRAISTPPFTGGLYIGNGNVTLLNERPFVIDHDQKISLRGAVHYSHRRGFYATTSISVDSGLVIGAADPATVAADPDYRDLLPYVDLLGDPPRAKSRTIAGAAFGYGHTAGDRKQWDVNIHVNNITAVTALYNFQSAFVGTRVVEPRAFGARLRWYF